MSLEIQLPGMSGPLFVEGMKLSVDRYMYDRYGELGELDKWLHWQATDYVMKNSKLRSVAIDRPYRSPLLGES
ncbi:hypothetical protein [Streptomyces misionensis]|uniref:hypothetical protein n=1 Tax=Streptomyces misionensis TaxID=67331 RepID=UPI0036908B51